MPTSPPRAKKKQPQRLSQHFALNLSQWELDFVDVPIHTDIPLFVDPYALQISGVEWLEGCADLIVDYFEVLVGKIRNNQKRAAMDLLDSFHEPNDTHLGYSSRRPAGRGWGETHKRQLYDALSSSAAMKKGSLNDLGDYELLLPGVGPDRISDLATNVIRGKLIEYTEQQCAMLGVPVSRIPGGLAWSPKHQTRINSYANLPSVAGERILFVPKAAVRTRLVADYSKYYRRFVLDFLEAELIDADDSLVKVLQNGKRKVARADLKDRFPMDREYLVRFSELHPDVLESYKEVVRESARAIDDELIESRQEIKVHRRSPDEMEEDLRSIPAGREAATVFHRFTTAALTRLFYPSLTLPKEEQPMDEGRQRLDILFGNAAKEGFFDRISVKHHIKAPYVVVECKNYSKDPENPEIQQLRARLGRRTGNFGILVCRQVNNKALLLKRLKDITANSDHVVLVLDDVDISRLLKARDGLGSQSVDEIMQAKLDEILI